MLRRLCLFLLLFCVGFLKSLPGELEDLFLRPSDSAEACLKGYVISHRYGAATDRISGACQYTFVRFQAILGVGEGGQNSDLLRHPISALLFYALLMMPLYRNLQGVRHAVQVDYQWWLTEVAAFLASDRFARCDSKDIWMHDLSLLADVIAHKIGDGFCPVTSLFSVVSRTSYYYNRALLLLDCLNSCLPPEVHAEILLKRDRFVPVDPSSVLAATESHYRVPSPASVPGPGSSRATPTTAHARTFSGDDRPPVVGSAPVRGPEGLLGVGAGLAGRSSMCSEPGALSDFGRDGASLL